jgi:spoIIIJ-associated protein
MEEGKMVESEEVSGSDSPGDVAADFLLDVTEAMGMTLEVDVEDLEDGTFRLDLVGDEAGQLIGRYGNTLNALQYLTGLMLQRRTGQHVRLLLDADGYRSRRETALVEQANELAAQVIQAGQEAELDPLSAFERRIIHNALAGHPQVITYSEGEEPERRVIIAPRPAAADS